MLVTRLSTLVFRLSFTDAAPVCVAPEPRMEPRGGKVERPARQRGCATEGGPHRARSGRRGGRGAARRATRDDGLSDGLPVAHVVVPARRRPAAVRVPVISDCCRAGAGGCLPVRTHASAPTTNLCSGHGSGLQVVRKFGFGFRRVLFLYHLRLGIYFCTIYVVRIRSTLITGCPERRGTQPR